MNLYKLILTKNRCYTAGKKITPKGVMWHSTGANNTDLKRYVGPDDGLLGENKNGNHWNRADLSVCVHAFIGKLKDGTIATYQTLPWDHRGWHAGDDANNTHISFEICEDGLTDEAYFRAVYQEAVELTAYLCETYGLDPLKDGVVIDHSEGYKRGIASNHGDVSHWLKRFGLTMDDVRQAVSAKMEENTKTDKEENAVERRYNTVDEIPAYAKTTIQKLVDKGYLNGTTTGLDLSLDMIRMLVILDRAGCFS